MSKKVTPDELEAAVQQAVDAYTGFRGDPPQSVDVIEVPQIDPVLLTMGECLGVMYETTRDGKREKYIHQFKKSARPLLCVSSDGLQLYLIGGSYSVTDHGIEDA